MKEYFKIKPLNIFKKSKIYKILLINIQECQDSIRKMIKKENYLISFLDVMKILRNS